MNKSVTLSEGGGEGEQKTMIIGRLLPRNMHSLERGLRVLAGIGILSLSLLGPGTLWGFLGLIPLATGLFGSCPLYTLLGISTCRMNAP